MLLDFFLKHRPDCRIRFNRIDKRRSIYKNFFQQQVADLVQAGNAHRSSQIQGRCFFLSTASLQFNNQFVAVFFFRVRPNIPVA
ncbi:MAG: hypothetical protein GY765_31680 [bacterium]|nr:hypothetical protein [bacterium]